MKNESNKPVNKSTLESAELLIWSLLDGNLSETETRRLESLIKSNEAIRTRYLECVQMHSDLLSHFQEPAPEMPAQPQSPVLGSLGEMHSPADSFPPVNDS